MLNKADPLARILERGRVRAVLAHYEKDLKTIFSSYAAADQGSVDARATADSVNLQELLYMMNEGKMMDDRLNLRKLNEIFSVVNVQSEAEEGGDEDGSELVFEEWVQVVSRCCDAKVAEEHRNGEEFEWVLQRWLHYSFIPTYKSLLKDKARGIASKTL